LLHDAASLSYSSFAGLSQLDVGICENITNGGGCTGQGKAGTAPTSIAWSADGSTVTFTYPGLTGSLNFLAGIIMTNSENFVRGANICMNGNVCSGGFQPVHAPDPIVGAGFPGLVFVLATSAQADTFSEVAVGAAQPTDFTNAPLTVGGGPAGFPPLSFVTITFSGEFTSSIILTNTSNQTQSFTATLSAINDTTGWTSRSSDRIP
jgi:hypothetical protein